MPYLHKDTPRLALKLFRGEPAISGFDWNFSPTHTPHRHPFQRMCVRTSKAFYGSFILDMGRSPGFGPAASDFRPLKTRFPYGCSPTGASPRRSPQLAGPFYKKYAVALTACGAPAGRRHRVSGSLSLPSRGPFHLSLTVLYAIGHWVVFSLGGWSPRFPTRFPVSRGTPDPAPYCQPSCTGLSPSAAGSPKTVPLAYPK